MTDSRYTTLRAFEGVGIELEYTLVDRSDLSCRPIADALLRLEADSNEEGVSEIERGMMGWSNELVMHVVEIKNSEPTADLELLAASFQKEVGHINHLLEKFDARLMPSAMHPWMDPIADTRLWPHGNADIYEAYAAIFDTKTHGWCNLQSMHINLPFSNDAEFARLHAAVRLLLPIIPALSASSPIADGRNTGYADYRMEVYRTNAPGFDSISGKVIPENASSQAEYEQKILAPMYRDIAPHDPHGILQYEWLNSHGAIARFDRNAIEIRVVDTQECPHADIAVASAVMATAEWLYDEGQYRLDAQQAVSTLALSDIFLQCIRDGERAMIRSPAYLKMLGYPGRQCEARVLWRFLIERMMHDDPAAAAWKASLENILDQGPLSRRILRAVGAHCSRDRINESYGKLCDCLQAGTLFRA